MGGYPWWILLCDDNRGRSLSAARESRRFPDVAGEPRQSFSGRRLAAGLSPKRVVTPPPSLLLLLLISHLQKKTKLLHEPADFTHSLYHFPSFFYLFPKALDHTPLPFAFLTKVVVYSQGLLFRDLYTFPVKPFTTCIASDHEMAIIGLSTGAEHVFYHEGPSNWVR